MENSFGTFLHRTGLPPAPQLESAGFRATHLPPLALYSMPAATHFCYHLLPVLKVSVSLFPLENTNSLPPDIHKDRTCLTARICCCKTLRCTLSYTWGQLHWSHILVSHQGVKPNQPELNKPLSNFLIAPPSRGCFWREKNPESCFSLQAQPHPHTGLTSAVSSTSYFS